MARAWSAKANAVFNNVEGQESVVLPGAGALLEHCRPAIVLEAWSEALVRNEWGLEHLARELSEARHQFLTIGRFGLEAYNLRTRGAENWQCLPVEKEKL